MFRRLGSRIAVASALTLTVIGTLAGASIAQASTVGPNQFFIGHVYGLTAALQNGIAVECAAATVGHPAPGQTVDVTQVLPPVTPVVGFTGTRAVEIDAALIFPVTPVSSKVPVATFTQYDLRLPIPTSIVVPCGGSGVMQFSPYPLDSGRPYNVDVTFIAVPPTS